MKKDSQAKTIKKHSFKNYLNTNLYLNIKYKMYLFVGRIARFITRSMEFYDLYESFVSVQNRKRLSQADIESMVSSEQETIDSRYVNAAMSQALGNGNAPNPQSRHQQVADVCIELINQHKYLIKNVVNVGARVDFVSPYLAPKFPDINFTSVDFQKNLDQSNSFLPQSENWSFKSSYALDVFESQELKPDLVIFISTSVLFTNKELKAYFAALSKFAKFIVLNEPFWHPFESLNYFKVFKPEDIDPDNSLRGGSLSNYLHNYPAILSANGFEIISSELYDRFEREKLKGFRLQIVAKNKLLDEKPVIV